MSILYVFIKYYFADNEINNLLAQPAQAKNVPRLLPVGLISLFCSIFIGFMLIWVYSNLSGFSSLSKILLSFSSKRATDKLFL